MSEMIERVAVAICRQPGSLCVGFCHNPNCKDAVAMHGAAARAAIEAMREPMPETIDAMKINIGPLAAMWRAAIDAALVEDTHEIKQGGR